MDSFRCLNFCKQRPRRRVLVQKGYLSFYVPVEKMGKISTSGEPAAQVSSPQPNRCNEGATTTLRRDVPEAFEFLRPERRPGPMRIRKTHKILRKEYRRLPTIYEDRVWSRVSRLNLNRPPSHDHLLLQTKPFLGHHRAERESICAMWHVPWLLCCAVVATAVAVVLPRPWPREAPVTSSDLPKQIPPPPQPPHRNALHHDASTPLYDQQLARLLWVTNTPYPANQRWS